MRADTALDGVALHVRCGGAAAGPRARHAGASSIHAPHLPRACGWVGGFGPYVCLRVAAHVKRMHHNMGRVTVARHAGWHPRVSHILQQSRMPAEAHAPLPACSCAACVWRHAVRRLPPTSSCSVMTHLLWSVLRGRDVRHIDQRVETLHGMGAPAARRAALRRPGACRRSARTRHDSCTGNGVRQPLDVLPVYTG